MELSDIEENEYLKIEEDEDKDSSSEKKVEEKPKKSWITPQFLSILTSVILVSGACFSIDWTSVVFLLTGCLCLSKPIEARSLKVITVYGILIFMAEVTFLIVLFTTNLSNNFDPFIGELLADLGFPSATRSIAENVFHILPEGLVVVGLIFVSYLSRNNHKDEARKARKPKSLFLCHLWFWLMIGFLVIVYTFGNSGCYLVISCTLYE